MDRQEKTSSWVLCLAFQLFVALEGQAATWQIGLGKADITPNESVRLSGYASRKDSSSGIADPLFARAMVLSPSQEFDGQSLVLVSIDSIGTTNALSVEIASWLEHEYAVDRSHVVLASTHSHAAPHLDGGLPNLYAESSREEQTIATAAYTRRVVDGIKAAVVAAIGNRRSGSLSIGQEKASFAVNRRVLKDGVWSGFGVQADGQIDHRVRVLLAESEDGRLLGGFFMYACHCTTLGGDFNQVSGDWAGLAAGRLEQLHPEAVFLPVIGCGADQNPNPRGRYEHAQQHALELVDGISRVLKSDARRSIEAFPVAGFGYAGLAPEQPTDETIQSMEKSSKPNERRWSEAMQRIKKERGRLPETYPMPIHTWRFGDLLTCVFLGGEVVVDYQFRIEKELPTAQTWVAAYTDDVFAYVASEKMRPEKGYEVDFSMIYYLQPGRWASGTQALIVRRVVEIFNNRQTERAPLSAEDSLKALRVPDGYRVELVASEPLVEDPINIAFGPDGRVWVVEMNDYPQGNSKGGCVKVLRDVDQDGRLDDMDVFLDGLSYPTSVQPWKDGAIVIAAPDVFFAADRDGDGRAEFRETWLSGFAESNPQHRAGGFEIGLNGWLHFGVGSGTKKILSHKNGQEYETAHRDVAWNPETGEIQATSGETQFIRSRDAFGNWFGNSNSEPMFQYPIEARYLSGELPAGGVENHLLQPAVAPPVYPRSETTDRYNDLYALNRYTSACSSVIARVPGIGRPGETLGFICEPVHNLVARIRLGTNGSVFKAERHPDDRPFDFLTSTDPASRPVRVVNAPDGTLWVVDMVRNVIEHPQWIPMSWQQRIDLRAGSNMGRIYRVFRDDFKPMKLPVVSSNSDDIAEALASNNGAVRDLALLRLLESRENFRIDHLRDLLKKGHSSVVRVAALGGLTACRSITAGDLMVAMDDSDPEVVRFALEQCEDVSLTSELIEKLENLPARNLGGRVDLQWLLTANVLSEVNIELGLKRIAGRNRGDVWIGKALSIMQGPERSLLALEAILPTVGEPDDSEKATPNADIAGRLGPLWRRLSVEARRKFVKESLVGLDTDSGSNVTPMQLMILSLGMRSRDLPAGDPRLPKLGAMVRDRILDQNLRDEQRIMWSELLGSGCLDAKAEFDVAKRILSTDNPSRLKKIVLESLRTSDSMRVPGLILESRAHLTTADRSAAYMVLLSKPSWAGEFVGFLEQVRIRQEELEPAVVQQLTAHRDRSVRSRAIAFFGKPTPRDRIVSDYLEKMPAPFSDQSGEELYRTHCVACHESKYDRPAIAPSLENLRHWTLEQWVTSVLHPNRNVDAKYLQSVVMTDTEVVLNGIVLESSAHQMRLAQSDGTIREIPMEQITDIKTTNSSLMPEGFETKLTPRQLAVLIGFLRFDHRPSVNKP